MPRSRAFSASTAGGAAVAGRLYIAGTGESNKLGIGDSKDRESPTLIEALKVRCARTIALRARGRKPLLVPAGMHRVHR